MADNIKQYSSPIDSLKPNETGTETLARMGRVEAENMNQAGGAIAGAAKQVGTDVNKISDAVDNHDYLKEVSEGSAGLAIMNNNLATKWNQTLSSSDPNDSSVQQKYMDNAEQQISDWQSNFSTKRGQQYAQTAGDQMRNHLWEHTSADMNLRAGDAAVNNMNTSLQGWKDTVRSNPAAIPDAMRQIDLSVEVHKDAASGMLGAGQLNKIDNLASSMKSDVVQEGLKGLADGNNPQATLDALNSGKYKGYLNDQQTNSLRDYANTAIEAKQVDKDNQDRVKQQQLVDRNDQSNGQYLGLLTQGKMPSAAQIVSDDNLSRADKSLWVAKNGILNMDTANLHTASLGDNFAATADGVYGGQTMTAQGLLTGIRRGEISPAGAAQIQKMQQMAKTPQGMAELQAQKSVLQSVQSQMVKGGPYASDPVGQQQYNSFLNTFYSSWDAAIKKGDTPAQLSDPKNKDYIGNMAQQFKRTDAQAISDVVNNARQQNVTPSQPAAQTASAKAKTWVIKDGQLVPGG